MAKMPVYRWECDGPSCNIRFESEDDMSRYMNIPPGWAEISITELNEEEEACVCACHDEETDEEGENLAGHEDWNCEECPDEDDWQMAMTLCPSCYLRFKTQWSMPRKNA